MGSHPSYHHPRPRRIPVLNSQPLKLVHLRQQVLAPLFLLSSREKHPFPGCLHNLLRRLILVPMLTMNDWTNSKQ